LNTPRSEQTAGFAEDPAFELVLLWQPAWSFATSKTASDQHCIIEKLAHSTYKATSETRRPQ
jgi:hypothetical protein